MIASSRICLFHIFIRMISLLSALTMFVQNWTIIEYIHTYFIEITLSSSFFFYPSFFWSSAWEDDVQHSDPLCTNCLQFINSNLNQPNQSFSHIAFIISCRKYIWLYIYSQKCRRTKATSVCEAPRHVDKLHTWMRGMREGMKNLAKEQHFRDRRIIKQGEENVFGFCSDKTCINGGLPAVHSTHAMHRWSCHIHTGFCINLLNAKNYPQRLCTLCSQSICVVYVCTLLRVLRALFIGESKRCATMWSTLQTCYSHMMHGAQLGNKMMLLTIGI